MDSIKSFIAQNLKVVGPFGGKFDFSVPRDLKIKAINFDYRTSKIKFNSARALKCYVNEKNLINGRVNPTISEFSLHIFETYLYNKYSHKSDKGLTLFGLEEGGKMAP